MKKLILTLFISILSIINSIAQIDSTQFLFPSFQEALVTYKDGRQFRVAMNYNLVGGCFLFIDTYDNNEMKRIAEPEMVVNIKIANRIFLPTERGATEIIQTEPAFYVQYKGKIRNQEKLGAYGTRSATSAISTYSSIEANGISHKLETEKAYLMGIYKRYSISKNGKMKKFINEKQFLKIYPKQKKQLEQYIDKNQIDFNVVNQVLQLFNYAETLK